MKAFYLLLIFFPLCLKAQTPAMVKGELRYDKDIRLEAIDKLHENVKANVLGYYIVEKIRQVRLSHDFSTFYFPVVSNKDSIFFNEVNLSNPGDALQYSFKNFNANLYAGNSEIISSVKTIVVDGSTKTGSTFADLTDRSFLAHVIVSPDSSGWEFKQQSYFEFINAEKQHQIVYAAIFYNYQLRKQAIKAWLVSDLPKYTSLTEAGYKIAAEVFKAKLPDEERIKRRSSLWKEVSFTTPKPLFVFEEDWKEKSNVISSFSIAGGNSLKYFWLDMHKSGGKNNKWLITPDMPVNVDATLNRQTGSYLFDKTDNNGLIYLLETENENTKSEKKYLVVYDLTKGEKRQVKKIELKEKMFSPGLSIAPDGSHVIVYNEFNTEQALLFDMAGQQLLGKINLPSAKERKLKTGDDKIYKYQPHFSRDSKRIYVLASYTWGTTIFGQWGNTLGTSVYLTTYNLK